MRAQFAAVARNYAVSQVHAHGKDLPVLLQLALLSGRETVLDAGCGPGPVTLLLAPHARSVTAVDFTLSMLEVAQEATAARNLSNVEFQLSGLEDFAATESTFDRIITRYSGHHRLDPVKVLRRFRKVIKPPRHLLIADVMPSEAPVLDTFLQAAEILRDPSHVRDHPARQWQRMCQSTGFRAHTVHRWQLRLEFGPWVERMATPPARIQALHQLFAGAGTAVKTAFDIAADYSFTVPCRILRAEPV